MTNNISGTHNKIRYPLYYQLNRTYANEFKNRNCVECSYCSSNSCVCSNSLCSSSRGTSFRLRQRLWFPQRLWLWFPQRLWLWFPQRLWLRLPRMGLGWWLRRLLLLISTRAQTSRVINTPPFFIAQSWMAICTQT